MRFTSIGINLPPTSTTRSTSIPCRRAPEVDLRLFAAVDEGFYDLEKNGGFEDWPAQRTRCRVIRILKHQADLVGTGGFQMAAGEVEGSQL